MPPIVNRVNIFSLVIFQWSFHWVCLHRGRQGSSEMSIFLFFPMFFSYSSPLALPGAKSCGARRVERLGRSGKKLCVRVRAIRKINDPKIVTKLRSWKPLRYSRSPARAYSSTRTCSYTEKFTSPPAIPHSYFPSSFNPLKFQWLCPVPADRADSHSLFA